MRKAVIKIGQMLTAHAEIHWRKGLAWGGSQNHLEKTQVERGLRVGSGCSAGQQLRRSCLVASILQ